MNDVVLSLDAGIGRIVLNRPRALNALNLNMIRGVTDALAAWGRDPIVKAVTVRGAGRAFCAGGDLRIVRAAAIAGDFQLIESIFREEYVLDALIARYRKPYVAIIDGLCMGGGVGISLHGRYRIVTRRTTIAMPETSVGFFPVGASYGLPYFPGATGLYLGLTGARLGPTDAIACGMATHYFNDGALRAIEDVLRNNAGDFDVALEGLASTCLEPSYLTAHRAAIDRCFSANTLPDIFAALEAENQDAAWARETLATLRRASPTALYATFALYRRGRARDLGRCLEMEMRLGQRMSRWPDFIEGVRAALIDKDRRPRWSPASIEAVDTRSVDELLDEATRPFDAATIL